VLCYSTPPLDSPQEVTGPVELIVYVSADVPDTDSTASLVDVHPDGRAELLTDGILRVRYRNSFERACGQHTSQSTMTPAIHLGSCSH
jgi:predicted acyl esterase